MKKQSIRTTTKTSELSNFKLFYEYTA